MGKNKKKTSTRVTNDNVKDDEPSLPLSALIPSSAVLPRKKRDRAPVKIVQCPASDFPQDPSRKSNIKKSHSKDFIDSETDPKNVLDFHKAVEEVRTLGTKGLPDEQKRKEEIYFAATGMKLKQKHNLSSKAYLKQQRENKEKQKLEEEEAKMAGLVTGSISGTSRKRQKEQQTFRSKRKQISAFGPAPDIGFMMHGMFKVQRK